MLEASAAIKLGHVRRQARIFGLHRPPVAFRDRGGGQPFDFGERRAGEHMHVPGLQVAVGGGAARALDQVADNRGIDRLVEKPAAGLARVDRFEDVHGSSTLKVRGSLASWYRGGSVQGRKRSWANGRNERMRAS